MKRSKGLQAILDERQRTMNSVEVRVAAIMILAELRDFSSEEKLSLICRAQRGGKGIEYDLAALLVMKPWAPYGREIEG